MTITANDRLTILQPVAGTTVLNWDFRLTRADGLTLLRERAGVTVTLQLGLDYSFPAGLGNAAGGSLTLAAVSLDGDRYLLVGSHPIERVSDYLAAQGFNSNKANGDLDAATMMLQELARESGRAVKVDFGSAGPKLTIGDESQVVVFDGDGNLVPGPAAGDIDVSGKLAKAAALSDLVDKGLSRKNLGVPAIVTSRAAAKALVPAADAAALILATSMEIGRFLWRSGDFAAMVAADTAEAVYLKAATVNANAGAWVRDFDYLLPEMFGDLSGTVADRTNAFKAAFTLAALLNAPLHIRKGSYILSDRLTGVGNPAIVGIGGSSAVELRWDAASANTGILINSANVGGSWQTRPSIEGLLLTTRKFNSGVALRVIGAAASNPGMPCARAVDIQMRGHTHPATDGWNTGIWFDGVSNSVWRDCFFCGTLNMPEPDYLSDYGFRFDNASGRVPHQTVLYASAIGSTYTKIAFRASDTEGVRLSDFDFIGTKTGVFLDFADAYPHHSICDGHVNASERCIDIAGGADIWVARNELFKQIGSNNGVGVYVRGAAKRVHIDSNIITHVAEAGDMNQIVMDNTASAVKLSGNTYRRSSVVTGQTLGMWVTNAGVTDVVIEDNQVFAEPAITPLIDAGTRTKKGRKPIVMQDAVAAVLTGSTAETTLATIVIPARTMGKNGSVRITSQFSASGAAGTRTLRNKFGGTTVLEHAATSAALSGRTQSQIHNRNATNSQIANGINQTNWASGGSAVVTSAIDTTAAVTILITGQLANAGDTMTLESWMVEIFPSY